MQGYQRRVHGDSANSVLLRKMMKSFIILNILVSVVVVNVGGQSSSPSWTDGECCPTKMVGGKKYRLVGQSDEAWDFGCSRDCTYKTRDSDVKYCFKPGSLNSECSWEEGEGGSRPPMTGTPGNRPPTTPGNRPPTTPGNRPPTTGGNRPPTTEGNRPTTAGGNTGGGSGASNEDYCNYKADHTMCKYPGPSASCSSKTIIRELSSASKEAILEKHNALRRRVAKGEETGGINPPQQAASNMKKLVWSTELEAVAQRWADQCTFGHDSERAKLDGTYVGQNAYWGGNSQQQDEAAVQAGMTTAAMKWYDEVTDPGFDSQTINPYTSNPGTGHYTQVVWADTEELGCGMVYYQGDSFFETLIVCNYAKGGNFLGSEMYKAGTPCADCPTGYTCEDGLCAKS